MTAVTISFDIDSSYVDVLAACSAVTTRIPRGEDGQPTLTGVDAISYAVAKRLEDLLVNAYSEKTTRETRTMLGTSPLLV